MSSDFLDNIEDYRGASILLTMRASGFAELTIIEPEGTEEGIATFYLNPDKKGWEDAIKIADSLKFWIEHTKKIQGFEK